MPESRHTQAGGAGAGKARTAATAPRQAALRRLQRSAVLLAALAVLATWGAFFDRSIRPDPFTSAPAFTDWLLNAQPHPALSRMPVVPVGYFGRLTPRPADTGWISSPWLPQATRPHAAGSAALPLIAPASAGMPDPYPGSTKAAPPPVVPAPQTQAPQTQAPAATPGQAAPAPPAGAEAPAAPPLVADRLSGQPQRLLAADVSPDGREVWIGGDAGRLLRSTTGGDRWQEIDTGFAAGSLFLVQAQGSDITTLTAGGWTLRTDNGGGSWSGRREPFAEGVFLNDEPGPSLWFQASAEQPAAVFATPRMNGGYVSPGGARYALLRDSYAFTTAFYAEAEPDVRLVSVPLSPTTDRAEAGDELARILASATPPPAFSALVRLGAASGLSPRVWLAGETGLLARVTLPSDGRNSPLLASTATGTRAHLRSLWFQPDGRIGWAASGWFDGNEESERPLVLQTIDGGERWERLSYRHLPAPWLLYLALPALVFAMYRTGSAAALLRAAPAARRSVADEASSDRPIGWQDADALGLQPIARALSKFLRNRNTEPPVTFAITGPWGSGKSSLMNLVAEDLRFWGSRPVWFNAWHHQKEEHLLAALLENIRTQAPPSWWRWTGLEFRLRLAWMRAGRLIPPLLALLAILVVALSLLAAMADREVLGQLVRAVRQLDFGMLVDKPGESLGGLAAALGIGGSVWAVFKALMKLQVISLDPAKLMSTLRGGGESAMRAQLSFRHRFAREFGEVCRALRAGGSAGMVIMIDDLDRCRAENVLEILEAVNFLTTAGRCFVILAIDEDKIVSAVAGGFRDSILMLPKPGDAVAPDEDLRPDARELAAFARNYLEKLINISVPVPTATAETSVVLLGALQGHALSPSPWPRRVRGGLRSGLDVAAALALFAGVVGATWLGLHGWIRPDAPAHPAAAAPLAAPSSAPALRAETALAAPETEAADPLWMPAAVRDLTAVPAWLHALPVVLALIFAALFAAGRVLAVREERVEDSLDFRDALRIWSPVIFAAHPSPRGVKRYQNRLRYLAMRSRGDEHRADWLDRLLSSRRLKAAGGGDTAAVLREPVLPETMLPEPALVALGALWAYDPRFANGQISDLENRVDAELKDTSDMVMASAAAPANHEDMALIAEQHRARRDVLRVAIAPFKQAFPEQWPPSAAQIAVFRAISGVSRGG